MEHYGTCLWFLKKVSKLSTLGQEMQDAHRNAPETWCVIGDFFSLTEERDRAIQCFERAIQIDDEFVYAHTLRGHEFFTNGDIDHALKSFRTAISINQRHYNAFTGRFLDVTEIFVKQERYDVAEYHVSKAIEINPSSPVLLNFKAVIVQRSVNRREEALQIFEAASKLAPHDIKFQLNRIQLLIEMGKLEV
eukprot:jgi/Hompol1/4137/HPOL_006939-RA